MPITGYCRLISIFSIIFFSINYYSNTVVYQGRIESYLETSKDIDQNLKSSVFLCGDSHAKYIDSVYLAPEIYNFAYGSDSYFDIYFKLSYLLK